MGELKVYCGFSPKGLIFKLSLFCIYYSKKVLCQKIFFIIKIVLTLAALKLYIRKLLYHY
jgi:hypothetical protein